MTIDLATITLTTGAHTTRFDGLCLLELAAWIAGEPHTDRPACVSPILATYGRRLNDVLPDDKRQTLIPLAPLMTGTAGDGHDEARGYLALDWMVRTYTPTWLDLAGLTAEAQELRGLRRIVDLSAAQTAGPVVRSARVKAAAAGDAAWAVAGDAAWDAAWAGAGAAAADAAWAAVVAGAWDAAWDAVVAGAGAAAWDAAWDAAADAAWDAAWAGAWDAAWDALTPTVNTLQDSAIQLLAAMINPDRDPRTDAPDHWIDNRDKVKAARIARKGTAL